MISLSIALDDLIHNPNQPVDWQALSEEELLLRLGQIYSFLPAPMGIAIKGQTVIIESPFASQDNRRSRKLLEKATAEASRGRYAQALNLLEKFLTQVPDSVDGRRNLGMVYLEMGQMEAAEKHLLEAYHLDPQDAYTLLLLGNITLDHKEDESTGEWFYQRAIQANPDDPNILTNMAGMLARREEYDQAQGYFRRALAALDELFAQPESMDIRSEAVYEEARRLYSQINADLAEASRESSMAYINQWREEVEEAGGIEIEIVQANLVWIMPHRSRSTGWLHCR
jgi:tetratricopeptide (TPR) repeat protein